MMSNILSYDSQNRHLRVSRPEAAVHFSLDMYTFKAERNQILISRTENDFKDVSSMLQNHRSGTKVLDRHHASLYERSVRHLNSLSLQARMGQAMWDDHQPTEREARRLY